MALNEERLRYLLRLFADNKAKEQEIREMLTLLRKEEGDKELESFMMELRQEEGDSYTSTLPVDWEAIWDNIHQPASKPLTPVRKMNWMRVAAAAIFIMMGTGAYYWFSRTEKMETVKSEPIQKPKNDVQPGGNRAILTLADGSEIILDSAANGKLAQQGNAEIIKSNNGQLVYKGKGNQSNEVLYNTMSTPRGGLYKLVLPDGSMVWLNAVSSIRFPTVFTGKERTVEITGEAYFEVVKNPSQPFRVMVAPTSVGGGGMEVSVLGTHFNINAYQDEATIKTTLLEGSVKVSKGASHSVIKPGQQTVLNNSGAIKVIHNADVAEAVAWKDGRFEFNDADLKTIMRQVMRWYDVDVEYQGNIPDRYFTADISRNKTLSGVLKILKLSDVDFTLEGKKLIVTP